MSPIGGGGGFGRSASTAHTPLPRAGHVTVQSGGGTEEEEGETLPKRLVLL